MQSAELPDAESTEPRPRSRRRGQVSLQECLELMSGLCTLCSLAHWFPGVAAVLLFLIGWLIPAAVILGVLVLLQWPVMVVMLHHSARQRNRVRKERRELRLLTPRL